MRTSAVTAFIMLSIACPALADGSGGARLAQSPVPQVADGQALAVARMVGGILSYTRWPHPTPVTRLCVAGAALHAERLAGADPATGRVVELRALAPAEEAAVGQCDALYLGRMPSEDRARLIAAVRGRPVVTMDENDPPCRAGAMFCLSVAADSLSFQLNLDAVSRGSVRIDPRVLLLSRAPEARQ